MEKEIREELKESLEVKSAVARSLVPQIRQTVELILTSLRAGGKVVLFGNGGSAADAQHLAAEFVNKLQRQRAALPAIALTTDTSILTAVGNDSSFDDVFSRQVEALVVKGDIAVAISTSGNSPNVLKAAKKAREKEAIVLGLTGQKGDKLTALCDLCLKVPSTSAPRIQEAHITIGHIICSLVEKRFFEGLSQEVTTVIGDEVL